MVLSLSLWSRAEKIVFSWLKEKGVVLKPRSSPEDSVTQLYRRCISAIFLLVQSVDSPWNLRLRGFELVLGILTRYWAEIFQKRQRNNRAKEWKAATKSVVDSRNSRWKLSAVNIFSVTIDIQAGGVPGEKLQQKRLFPCALSNCKKSLLWVLLWKKWLPE